MFEPLFANSYDDAVEAARLRELVDTLESDARLTESLQVRPLRERVRELEQQLEAVTMWPDVRNYIAAQYPGLIKQIEATLKAGAS
jgi:hypothetical protein